MKLVKDTLVDDNVLNVNAINFELAKIFTVAEIRKAVSTLNNNKVSSFDNVTNAYMKCAPDSSYGIVCHLFALFLLEFWSKGIVLPICKNKVIQMTRITIVA